MPGFFYEPPYLGTILIMFKIVGISGTVVNIGGIVVSMMTDTKRMNIFANFILNVQVWSTISLIYVTFLACPYFLSGFGLTYNGILTYNFNVSPYVQTTFFVLTYCSMMCSYLSTYLYLHQAVMSPFDRFRFSTRTLIIVIAAVYLFVFGLFPILYSFCRPDPAKLEAFLLKKGDTFVVLANATNLGFYNVNLNSFIYWLQAITCTAWAAIILFALTIVLHILYTFQQLRKMVLLETRNTQMMWFKSFLMMTSIPVLTVVPSALIMNVLLWDTRPYSSLVINLLNVLTNIHSPLVTLVILMRIRGYSDTIKACAGRRVKATKSIGRQRFASIKWLRSECSCPSLPWGWDDHEIKTQKRIL